MDVDDKYVLSHQQASRLWQKASGSAGLGVEHDHYADARLQVQPQREDVKALQVNLLRPAITCNNLQQGLSDLD